MSCSVLNCGYCLKCFAYICYFRAQELKAFLMLGSQTRLSKNIQITNKQTNKQVVLNPDWNQVLQTINGLWRANPQSACCHTQDGAAHIFPHFQQRGLNSSVGSAWAHCPQRRGFDPPLGTFSSRGDFSLGVNMGSNSIPPKTPSDESINRGLVCAHMLSIARTQKILTFMS